MWDTAIETLHDTRAGLGATSYLTHDRPCSGCGHPEHRYLSCSDTCDCVPPPVPGSVGLAA